jgi:hypothetical protein
MGLQRAAADLEILSIPGTVTGGPRLLSYERVPGGRQDHTTIVSREALTAPGASNQKPAKAEQPMTRVRVIEVLDGQPKNLLGEYHFARLPKSNDTITVANRRGAYDVMRILYLVYAPEVTAYVRWIRMKIFNTLAEK